MITQTKTEGIPPLLFVLESLNNKATLSKALT